MIPTDVERNQGAGRVGAWRCELPFDIVEWSSAVYDIFELPRGFRVTREESLGFYTDESRKMLDVVRTRAIQECTGFTLDAEILTALGKTRWIRITATVEYENGAPARLFGTKQDITEEKAASGNGKREPFEPTICIEPDVNPIFSSAQHRGLPSAHQSV